ncbi:MAG TPA: O-acetylhomoserine aminocarboxypropyltransferase [Acidimicrobiia bacterium]
MAKPEPYDPDTLALHAGQHPDSDFGARAVPIYQTAAFVFPDADTAASRFNIERTGHVYSRLTNPTNAVLEERISALEGGVGAIATSSGQAATHLGIATLMGAGSHIVSSQSIYGGSHNLLAYTLPRFGIETTFVDPRDPAAFSAAIRPNTRLIFGETIGNPGMEVFDVPTIAEIAHQHGVPLMIDSTFTTPVLARPFDMGADIVVHSATKFLSGHGVVIGGLLVDAGAFDWQGSGKFPTMTEPYEGFHNLVFHEEFGPTAFITRARKEGARDFGPAMAPMTAFLILQGIETLGLRMRRHVENAMAVAKFLEDHEAVEWVRYPGLESHPDYELARRLLPRGAGSIFSFGIRGGRAAGQRFIENVVIASHLANVGDAKTLVIHPASTTHHRMDSKALEEAGISEGLIRISVGLEGIDDLIEDLGRALHASQRL